MTVSLALLVAAAATLSAGASDPPGARSAATAASKICIADRGAILLNFYLWDTVTNLVSTTRTMTYAEGAEECMDMRTVPDIEPGHPVVAVVTAVGGVRRSLQAVVYEPLVGDQTSVAAFACSGSASHFSCSVRGAAAVQVAGLYMAGSPAAGSVAPVHANDVCVQKPSCKDEHPGRGGAKDQWDCDAFRMEFRLWDTVTNKVGQWTGGVDAGDTICVGRQGLDAANGDPIVVITRRLAPGLVPGSETAHRSFIYDDSAPAATYTCKGFHQSWTLGYDCQPRDGSRRLQGTGEGRLPRSFYV